MKPVTAVVLAILASALIASAGLTTRAGVTPVQKVIQMLHEMVEKGKQERQDEQVQFAAFKQFCEDTTRQKTSAIEDGKLEAEGLQADQQRYGAEAEDLQQAVSSLDADIALWEGDMKAANMVRDIERTDYEARHKDLEESIDALNRAILVLKKQNYDRKQAELLIRKAAKVLPAAERSRLEAFLAEVPTSHSLLELEAPEANAYEFQSSGIVDMLEKMLGKFEDEMRGVEKEEQSQSHAFDLLMQDLANSVKVAKESREKKATIRAKKLQAQADAKGDLKDTQSTVEADTKYLNDLMAECETKAQDFASRQTLRKEELEALNKAIEIISGGAVSGNAEKHLPQMIQVKGNSFVQLRAGSVTPQQSRAAKYLKGQGEKLHSRVLTAIAIRAQDDPFKTVKKMIKDLITKLLEEANEEATHKGWCDTELRTNEATRNDKTTAVETLHAEIDQLEASVEKLGEEVQVLTTQVADIDTAVQEATEVRHEEKVKNQATIKDAKEAQVAIAQAIQVLNEFYAKAAEATALVQDRKQSAGKGKKQPEIFDSPYQGMGGQAGGVVAMLETIQQDFGRLEAETASAEEQAQKTYDGFMADSATDKASKKKDIEHKSNEKQDQEQALVMSKEDLEGTQKELTAAVAYFDKLKPSCVDQGMSYEERVARRKEEIQSLQEALSILNGEDIA